MSSELTQQFINALAALESSGSTIALEALFSDESEIGNVVSPREFTGPSGARAFWTMYRSWFGELKSTYLTIIVGEDGAALEWTTTGTGGDGSPISYDGVSVLTFTENRISRFRAYFNPGVLERQLNRR